MAGYNFCLGMSNNAVAAYEDGVKPLSQITRADLQDAGLAITLQFAKWLAKRRHWQSDEWHHSGGSYFNRVKFYDPRHLAELVEDGDLDLVALQELFQAEKREARLPDEGIEVSGTYAVWERRYGRNVLVRREAFQGTKVGDWIHLGGGGKKKASGKHISWVRAT